VNSQFDLESITFFLDRVLGGDIKYERIEWFRNEFLKETTLESV
jgi:hypothetical protein